MTTSATPAGQPGPLVARTVTLDLDSTSALLDLLRRPELARTMGERGRRHVEERFGAQAARRTLRAALDLPPDPVA